MKVSMDYFDSEALIKQQEISSLKITPPPPSLTNLPSNASPKYEFSLKDSLCDRRML